MLGQRLGELLGSTGLAQATLDDQNWWALTTHLAVKLGSLDPDSLLMYLHRHPASLMDLGNGSPLLILASGDLYRAVPVHEQKTSTSVTRDRRGYRCPHPDEGPLLSWLA